MAIIHIDGFDQFQGQAASNLLGSLVSAGYTVSSGLAMADARSPGGYALELQVAAGTAGASWSSRTNNIKQDLHAIAANSASRFVAVGNNGVAVGSDDNVTWLPVILGVPANMRDIDVAGSTWIAVGTGSTILRSTDGKNFAVRPAPLPNMTLNSVATNGAGVWVIVGANGAAGMGFVSIDDGMSWSPLTGMGARANLCVEYGAGVWLVGGTTGQLLSSNDASVFSPRTLGAAGTVNALGYADNGHWLAATGADLRRSIDSGVTWAPLATAVLGTAVIVYSVEYADGRWVVAGAAGQIRYSDDEDAWTKPDFAGVAATTIYNITTLRGNRSGWAAVGALNAAQPVTTRTAIIYVALAPPTRVARTFRPAAGKFTIGFAHRSTARGRILSITDVLDMDWPAAVEIGEQVGQAVPARNVWYYYELVIDPVGLTADLYINDTLDLTVPLDPAVAEMTSFDVTWIAENGAVTRIDDVYMVDTSTPNSAQLVDRLGPIAIPLRLPRADVLTEWTPSSGTQHWPLVGLLPPSTESYIRSATSGAQDLFTSDTPLPDGAGSVDNPILAVGVIALAQKGDIDNRQLGLAIGAPGPTQLVAVDTVLSVVPEYSYAVFERAPGNLPWTVENTETTPFGVVVKP